MLEVLQDFSSARLPLEWLIQLCPRLQPRQFSIACSQKAHPQQAHITLAVVDYRTPFKRRKRGLCSKWLSGLSKGRPISLAQTALLSLHIQKFQICEFVAREEKFAAYAYKWAPSIVRQSSSPETSRRGRPSLQSLYNMSDAAPWLDFVRFRCVHR